jgi:hypothetical protein
VAAEKEAQKAKMNHAEAKVAWAEARVEALNTANHALDSLRVGLGGERFPDWITAADDAVVAAKDDLKELRLALIPAQVPGAARASVVAPEYSFDDLIQPSRCLAILGTSEFEAL